MLLPLRSLRLVHRVHPTMRYLRHFTHFLFSDNDCAPVPLRESLSNHTLVVVALLHDVLQDRRGQIYLFCECFLRLRPNHQLRVVMSKHLRRSTQPFALPNLVSLLVLRESRARICTQVSSALQILRGTYINAPMALLQSNRRRNRCECVFSSSVNSRKHRPRNEQRFSKVFLKDILRIVFAHRQSPL